jgi:hypothetical protein
MKTCCWQAKAKRLPHFGWLWSRRFRLPTRVFNGVGMDLLAHQSS